MKASFLDFFDCASHRRRFPFPRDKNGRDVCRLESERGELGQEGSKIQWPERFTDEHINEGLFAQGLRARLRCLSRCVGVGLGWGGCERRLAARGVFNTWSAAAAAVELRSIVQDDSHVVLGLSLGSISVAFEFMLVLR